MKDLMQWRALSVLCILILTADNKVSGGIPTSYKRKLILNGGNYDWDDSVNFCLNRNGYLVNIDSQSVTKAIQHFSSSSGRDESGWTSSNWGNDMWTGLYVTSTSPLTLNMQGTCEIYDYSNLYTAWDSSLSSSDAVEKKCVMLKPGSLTWTLEKCDQQYAFICEVFIGQCTFELESGTYCASSYDSSLTTTVGDLSACYEYCKTLTSGSNSECWAVTFDDSNNCYPSTSSNPFSFESKSANCGSMINPKLSRKRCFEAELDNGNVASINNPNPYDPIPVCSFTTPRINDVVSVSTNNIETTQQITTEQTTEEATDKGTTQTTNIYTTESYLTESTTDIDTTQGQTTQTTNVGRTENYITESTPDTDTIQGQTTNTGTTESFYFTESTIDMDTTQGQTTQTINIGTTESYITDKETTVPTTGHLSTDDVITTLDSEKESEANTYSIKQLTTNVYTGTVSTAESITDDHVTEIVENTSQITTEKQVTQTAFTEQTDITQTASVILENNTCSCKCQDMTNILLDKFVEELIAALKIDAKNTSSAKRKLISVKDMRTSNNVIGTFMIVCLIGGLSIFLISDLGRLLLWVKNTFR